MPSPDPLDAQFVHAVRAQVSADVSPAGLLSSSLVDAALLADAQMCDDFWIDTDPEAVALVREMAVDVGVAILTAMPDQARDALARMSSKVVVDTALGYYDATVIVVHGLSSAILSYALIRDGHDVQSDRELMIGFLTAWTAALSLFVALAPRDPQNLWMDFRARYGGSVAPGSVPEDRKGHSRSQEDV